MKAFILAAGYGTRMRPLTDSTPKPLLKAAGKPLIEYHIERLAAAGIRQIVINTAYLGDQIEAALGDGARFGVRIDYSREGEPLETGGAIVFARELLGDEPFLLVNGDIYCEYPFALLLNSSNGTTISSAHLVLVPNPEFKEQGDFSVSNGYLSNHAPHEYTYAGIGIYNPNCFEQYQHGESFALGPWLRTQAEQQNITAEIYQGTWMDIGTPQRLQQLEHYLQQLNTKEQQD